MRGLALDGAANGLNRQESISLLATIPDRNGKAKPTKAVPKISRTVPAMVLAIDLWRIFLATSIISFRVKLPECLTVQPTNPLSDPVLGTVP